MSAELTDVQRRIEYCKDLGEEPFDETEYMVHTSLKILSGKESDKKKAKVVADIIKRATGK